MSAPFLRLRGDVDATARSFELGPGEHVVGSSRDCAVRLKARGVSRRHAELRVDPAGQLEVVDLGSRNGTWVHGKRFKNGASGRAHPGMELRFGPVRLQLEAVDAVDAELAIALPELSGPDFTALSVRSLDASTHFVVADPDSAQRPEPLAWADGYRPLTAPPMVALYRQMRHLLRGRIPVLLVGETGVGKERLARLLHRSSERAEMPFVAINCAAIPAELLEAEMFGVEKGVATGVEARPGRFREAEGGTLFLDEIGEMSPALQAKLLRVLQENEVQPLGGRPQPIDVRVVAATNIEIGERLEDGRFRRDLYYRLAGDVLDVPPLRDCRDDIPRLVEHFLVASCGEAGKRVRGMSRGALAALEVYGWPGNVRQLENEVRRLVYRAAAGEVISTSMLSKEVRGEQDETAIHSLIPLDPLELEPRLRELEEVLIREALRRTEGNQTRAAELLGITRNGLAKKLKRLGIS